MHDDTRRLGGKVIHFANLNFAFLVGFENRLNDFRCRGPERYLCDDERLVVVGLGNAGAYLHAAATLAVVVFRYIDNAACREVRIELEFLAAQIGQRSVT